MKGKFNKLTNSFTDPVLPILIFGLAVGIFCGVFAGIGSRYISENTGSIFSIFLKLNGNGFFDTFVSCALGCLPMILFMLVFGLAAVGSPLIVFAVIFYGFSYGVFAGYIMHNYHFSGFLYNTFVCLIPEVIYAAMLIFLARESVRFSRVVFKQIKGIGDMEISADSDLSLYLFRVSVFSAFIILSCLIKAVFYSFLGNLSIFSLR